MKKKLLLLLLVIFSITSFAQSFENFTASPYFSTPETFKKTKPFLRQKEFFETRAYPEGFIPENAYLNAYKEKIALKQSGNDKYSEVQWTSLGPSSGGYFSYGNISSRVVTGAYNPLNPNIIYIGPANGGVWKSTNAGLNWVPLTDNQPSLSMGSIAIDPVNPNIIYAGTGEATYSGSSYYGNGLLKSTDAGATWQHITTGLPARNYFSRLVIRPGNSNHLLAALGTAGLYKSTDAGLTWNLLQSGRCDDVFYTSTDTAYIVGSGTKFRISVDGGSTFTLSGTGLGTGSRTHFDYAKSSSNIIYAAVYSTDVKIYKSTDRGQNFTQVALTTDVAGTQAWYDLYLRVHPQNKDIVFVGTIDVWKSTNGGTSFDNITNGYDDGNVHVDQHYLFFHPTDASNLIVCNDGGIWKSTNTGTSFINLNQTLTLTQFYRIAASPFNPSFIMGGTQDNGTQKTLGTLTWTAAFGGDGGEVCFNNQKQNFVIGEMQNGSLVRSTNSGVNWSSAMSGISTSETVTWVAPIIKHPTIADVFFIARQKVYKSTNNGATWTAISSEINGASAVREMAISTSNPNIMYASSSAKIFKSTDGGVTFADVTTGLPTKTITSINIHPDNPDIVLLTFSGFGTAKVFRTIDGGVNWVSVYGNLPNSPVNDLFLYTGDQTHPETYFAATDVGVYVTKDTGATWQELGNGLPNTVIMHLDFAKSTHTLRAGTHGRGVYEAQIDFTSNVELDENLLPVKAELLPNFPNPFNPSTTITYSVPVQAIVKLQIFNVIGELIAEPFNKNMDAGIHKYVWNAANQPSGTYIVNLIVTNENGETVKSSRKISLIK